jgi:hypothetical protein
MTQTAKAGTMTDDSVQFEGDLEAMIASGELEESPDTVQALVDYESSDAGRAFRQAYGERGFHKYLEVDPEVLGDENALGAFLKTPDGQRYIALAKDLLGKERSPRMDALVKNVASNHPVYSRLAGHVPDDELYHAIRQDIMMEVVEHEKMHDVFDRYGAVQNEAAVEDERSRFRSWRYWKGLGKSMGSKAYGLISNYIPEKIGSLNEAVMEYVQSLGDKYRQRQPDLAYSYSNSGCDGCYKK